MIRRKFKYAPDGETILETYGDGTVGVAFQKYSMIPEKSLGWMDGDAIEITLDKKNAAVTRFVNIYDSTRSRP